MVPSYKAAFTLASVVLFSASTAALAEDARVLRMGMGVCPSAHADLVKWASITEGYASYAVPVGSRKITGTCDNPGPVVPAASSDGFDSKISADSAALAKCRETMPAGYSGCAIVANSFDHNK